jgi:uncharacterized membrane protein
MNSFGEAVQMTIWTGVVSAIVYYIHELLWN